MADNDKKPGILRQAMHPAAMFTLLLSAAFGATSLVSLAAGADMNARPDDYVRNKLEPAAALCVSERPALADDAQSKMNCAFTIARQQVHMETADNLTIGGFSGGAAVMLFGVTILLERLRRQESENKRKPPRP
jgi:hypothetical protein